MRASATANSTIGITCQISFMWWGLIFSSCHCTMVAMAVESSRKKTPTPMRLFMLALGMHGRMMWFRKGMKRRTTPSSTKVEIFALLYMAVM